MVFQSIRWRLPVSYAVIAVLATICLGAALLATLRGYYAERELLHLEDNARAISMSVMQLQVSDKTPGEIQSQLQNLAFIVQSRVRILSPQGTVLIDTGTPSNMLTVGYAAYGSVGDPITMATAFVPEGASVMVSVPAQAAPFGMAEAGGMNMIPIESQMADPVLEIKEGGDVFQYAIASTPYGFDLVGEVREGAYSDQVVRMPLIDNSGVITGYVELSEGMSLGAQIVDNVAAALIFAGIAAIIIAAGVGFLVSNQIISPLIALTYGARHMAAGELATRVKGGGSREFGVLAQAFNEMATTVEATIIALRRFVADAAHELHTPLTALHADLELAVTEPDEVRRLQYVERARTQVARMESLTNNLLDLSRLEAKTSHTFHPVELTRLLHDMSESYASRAEQVNIQFVLDLPDQPVCVTGDEQQLRRAVANLLDNAIKFTPECGAVTLRLTNTAGQVSIIVADTGIGIPPDDQVGLFHRFHRARNANAFPGSGLGLAISRAIIDVHGGSISVQSRPGATEFTLGFMAY